jgi:hypothetical protein
MAVITPDTFNPLRRFVSVRLQQGVPIVDADWNEKDDMRRFEVRAFLKWFVGDGVPEGTDGFRLRALAVPAANDLIIGTGVPPAAIGETNLIAGLRHLGRCLVDGLEATIETEVVFRAQALHVSQGGSAALAAQLGTTQIAEMPMLDGTVNAYLDVWQRLVRPDEVPSLVFVDIGTESCARIRLEWAVRARIGTALPVTGDGDFEAGHSYYSLAHITRVAADPVVYPSQLADRRERRLLVPPAIIIEDLFGTTSDRYRRGLDRPTLPLRTALNALMRGELPSSDDQVIAPDPNIDFAARAWARSHGETTIFWHSNRVGGLNQVFGTAWPDADPALAATTPPVQVTAGPMSQSPSLVLLPTSPAPALLVAYQTSNNIAFRRAAALAGLPGAAETPVAAQAEIERSPLAMRAANIVTVFWHWNGPGVNDNIRYRRRQYDPTWAEGAAVWLDGETTNLSNLRPAAATSQPGLIHGAADSLNRLWIAFTTFTNNIAVVRLTPGTGAIETWLDLELDSGTTDDQPFVLVDEPGRVWVFWRGDNGIFHAAFDLVTSTWGPTTAVPGGGGALDENERPTAVIDPDGGIWLLWTRDIAGETDIWAMRRHPLTGGWGSPRQITASVNSNDYPLAVMEEGTIRLAFRSNRAGQFDLYTKNIITTV